MDKLIKVFFVNKKVLIFVFGLMVLGVISGSILPIFMSASDKKMVSEYLSNFILEVKGDIDSLFLLKNGFLCDGVSSFLIWIFGISVIGIPIVLFIFFSKCFIFGFSISSIIINYGFKGIFFSFVYVFPHNVISLIVYCFLSCYSFIFSFKLIGFILRKNDFNLRESFYRYFKLFTFLFVVLIICILYDSFVNPYILNFAFKLFGL